MIDRPFHSRRAFSLIELLVVILIIALVITIALPSLSGARNSARAASSRAVMNNIVQAAAQFERDERRMPGYFSARQMGHADNADRGLTAMQNVMLDLAGGISPNSTDSIQIGPLQDTATQAWVNLSYIGVERNGSKLYWVPDRKHYIAQDGDGQQHGIDAHRQLPSVVDAFGNPILAWVIDETAMGPITQYQQFAAAASPTSTSTPPARFYWNSNAGFLAAQNLGRRLVTTNSLRDGSMIAENVPATARARSLTGILGHPSYPYKPATAQANFVPEVPAAPRGSFVVHSAGSDNIYFSRADRGARQFGLPDSGTALGASHFIDYQLNFVSRSGGTLPADAYTDRDGRAINIDIVERFDDLIAVGGN